MLRAFKSNSVFIGLSLMLVIALGLALLCVPKGDLHMLLCDRHTPARDTFYMYYTQVAEWFPYVVCIALLLFSRIGDGVFASVCMIASSLTTQLLKHLINAPRPITWFAEHMPEVSLPMTDSVQIHSWYSFPSGHTTSFFALAFVLVILFTKKSEPTKIHRTSAYLFQLMLFIFAALGGYSRIYLSQHFALDVFAGIIVGLCITALFYAIFTRLENKKWVNYRLFSKK